MGKVIKGDHAFAAAAPGDATGFDIAHERH